MNIGIDSIAYYLPNHRLDTLGFCNRFDVSERLIREKTGFLKLVQKEDEQETSDLAVQAVRRLASETALVLDDVECIAVVTQNPDGFGLPHTSAIVHNKLSLRNTCSAFDISLGCSGYVYALSLMKGFMQNNQLSTGILITADPYSKIIDKDDKNTCLLFGDAATATLLTEQGDWQLGLCDFGTDGAGNNVLNVDDARTLHMNGRAVFNYSVKYIPQSILKTLEKNQMQLSDINHVVMHQGSKFIIQTLAERLSIENQHLFFAYEYGNTISSSIPLVLAKEQFLEKSGNVLISGFGVGFSWATSILTNNS